MPRILSDGNLGLGVVDDVGVAIEVQPVVAGQHLRLEQLRVGLGAGHGVEPERRAIGPPLRDDEDVVGQPAADDVGDLGEDVPDIQRTGHRVQQTAEAVDALAAQNLSIDDRRVLEGQAEQIDDAVHQGLMGRLEGLIDARGQPHRAVHAGALPHRAENPGARVRIRRVDRRRRVADAMLADLERARVARHIEHEGLGAVEPKHVQPLEGNRWAQRDRQSRHDVAKARGFGDQTRHGREDVHRIGLGH